jgi:hypothetical protein
MSAHIGDDAAEIAALPELDAERLAAYAHAASCAECAARLAEAESLLALIDAAPLPAPSAQVLQRTMNAVLAEFDAEDRVYAAARSRSQAPERMRPSVRPGVTKAPPRRGLVAAAAAVVVSALFALFDTHAGQLAFSAGIDCGLKELVFAAGAVGLGFAVSKGRWGALPVAALGAWGALVGQAYLRFQCPASHDAPHVFAFHFLGVLVAALVGLMLQPRPSTSAA